MTDIETADLSGDAGTVEAATLDTGVESVGEPDATSGSDATIETGGDVDDAPRYTVTVGGVEQEVTLEDLRSGFMRQADYTRKTQEVAQLRQRLAQAEAIANSLEADPESTLRALAEAYGLSESEIIEQLEEVDPVDSRLRKIEQIEQQRIAAETRAQIDREIDALVEAHGDFDLGEVIAHAAQHNMTVTDAYKTIHFDTLLTKAQQAEKIREQKRQAAVVEGGSHRTGVVENTPKAKSVRDAWAQAKQTLKIS